MKYGALLLAVLSSAVAGVAGAAEIGPCNEVDRVSWLVSPVRTFSNDKIRIAHVDTDGEPVCCSSHLLIFIPSQEIGSQCFALSQEAVKKAEGKEEEQGSPRGFSNIEFKQIKSSYDPNRGLLLNVPYTLYEEKRPRMAKVRIDLRNNGSVKIER